MKIYTFELELPQLYMPYHTHASGTWRMCVQSRSLAGVMPMYASSLLAERWQS